MVRHFPMPGLKAIENTIPQSLGRQSYPWYDSAKDAPRSVLGKDMSWLSDWFHFNPSPTRGGGGGGSWNWSDPGELLMLGLSMLALAILLVMLVEFWRRYRPANDGNQVVNTAKPVLGRIEGLPADIQPTSTDPWAEAQRLRESGDEVGSIIALFAHQLLTLDKLKQIRLTPGRTGRQFVKSVPDLELKQKVTSTLRLFEAAIYGHQRPKPEAFDRMWEDAKAFERRARDVLL